MSLTFKTSDISFLKQYNTEDINTKFKWDISLDGCVDASKCTYKINSSTIEINLSKHQSTSSVKWTNAIKPCVSMSEKNEIDLNETNQLQINDLSLPLTGQFFSYKFKLIYYNILMIFIKFKTL